MSEKICQGCKSSLSIGYVLQNDEEPQFFLMEAGEGMHLECYIKRCIDRYMGIKAKDE